MRALSSSEVEKIIHLIDSGHSNRQIASLTHHSTYTISHIWSEHHPDVLKSSGGRPLKLSPTDIRHAVHLINTGKADNATQVAHSLQSITNQSLSCETVCWHLKQAGMKAVVKKKHPLLSQCHRHAHLDFALGHQHWTVDDWMKVVWSDEVKFNRLGSDGQSWTWKRAGAPLSDCLVEGTLKFGGGSLMMWGCMTWEGPGYAAKIDGKMDADLYCEILEDNLLETLRYYNKSPHDAIFQQDNDPKHTSKKAWVWLQDHEFDVMQWPAQSPDLNPIEHLWHHVKSKLRGYDEPAKGIHELWDRVQEEWEKIEPRFVRI